MITRLKNGFKDLSSIGDAYKEAFSKRLASVGEELVNRARDNLKANGSVDSGELSRSIEYRVNNETDTVTLSVYSNCPYAPYVEYGTGVNAEFGNGRKTPWRYQRADGNWITTEGSYARPFMRPALADKAALVQQAAVDAFNDIRD